MGMTVGLLCGGHYQRLNESGYIIATTNGIGMALALARALGKVRVPVLLLAMGLLPLHPGKIQIYLYKYLARYIRIACISKKEQEYLSNIFVNQNICYVPFGVDQDFWHLAPTNIEEEPFVLAVGNDLSRDWITLVKAWSLDLPKLKIVTALPVPTAPSNVEVVYGDWRTRALTDKELRELYWRASVVIVPLKETLQPSGQSSCLQAMACGKSVVLSDISGLWDREAILNDKNVLLVPPGDVFALNSAVRRLLVNPELRQRLGKQARTTVENQFNTDIMATCLFGLLNQDHD